MTSELCACGKQKTTVNPEHPTILLCEHCDRGCNYGQQCERCKSFSAAKRSI